MSMINRVLKIKGDTPTNWGCQKNSGLAVKNRIIPPLFIYNKAMPHSPNKIRVA
jgi:hypothetical protein